ncbi:MAG: DndE family protein, partial [FCB group bacterium]
MADRLYTSKESDDILSALKNESKLDKFILARMAFALSLVKDGYKVNQSIDFGGSEMKRPTFVSSDEIFIKSVISFVYKKSDFTEDEFYSNKSIIK